VKRVQKEKMMIVAHLIVVVPLHPKEKKLPAKQKAKTRKSPVKKMNIRKHKNLLQ